MKKQSRTVSNLFYNMIYQVLILILPLITAPYISRVVGANGVGTYSYYHSIAIYFGYFAMLGISNYGNRTIAKIRDDDKKKNESFSSIYLLQLTSSLLIAFLYLVYVIFFVKENQIIASILFLSVTSSIFDVSWVYFGLEEFKITSLRQIIVRIVSFICIFVFVKEKTDLWIYTLIMSLSNLVSALCLWIFVWKRVTFKKVKIKSALNHLKPCLILFIPIIATSVYRQMDKIMVGSFSEMSEVGYYENAEKMISISLGLISSFSAVIMPKISNLIGNKKEKEADYLFDKSMEFAMLIGIAICFGIVAISNEFIPIFFGDEFMPSIKLSIYLAFSAPFISWANIVRVLHLIPREKDHVYVNSIILGAVINVVFNLIFIPKYNAFGAVIGTLAAESSVAIYQTIVVRKYLKVGMYLKQSLFFLVFGILMCIAVRCVASFLTTTVLNLILEIIVGVCVYGVLSIIYMHITKNDIYLKIIDRIKGVLKHD